MTSKVKVWFELEDGAWHGSATESLWATELADGHYRLENSPFYAFGVSFLDAVIAAPRNGRLWFDRVVKPSGHSTYRIIRTTDSDTVFNRCWTPLQTLGCSFESGDRVLAVDVPPEVNIHEAYKLLDAGEHAGAWGFEEGHCGHPLQ
ncbi:MAG: DUF4265 domain-containing protein [Alphaproteobacteria bacterium]|nr:DUF4265 domain-containing protein [Alphaproteobacteria bacterium]